MAEAGVHDTQRLSDAAVLSRDAPRLAGSASVEGVRGFEPQASEGSQCFQNTLDRLIDLAPVEEGSVLETQRLAPSIGVRSHVSTLADLPSETPSSIRQ